MTEPGTIAVSTLGLPAEPGGVAGDPGAVGGARLPARRRGRARPGPRRQYLHGDGARRLLGSPGDPPHRTRQSGALLVVTGCYAQTDAEAVARIPGVDLVVGNQEKYRLLDLLGDLGKRPPRGDPRRRRQDVKGRPRRAARPSRRALPGLRQDPGRMPAPLRLLHRPRRARQQPEPGAGGRCRAGCGVLVDVQVSRDHADRRGHRPLRPGPDAADEPGRAHRAVGAVPGLRWLRLSSVLPAYLERRADRGGHRHPRGGAPPPPAASERQRPRAPAHAPPVQSPDVPRAGGAARRGDPRSRPRHRLIVGHPGEGDDDFEATLRAGRGAAAVVPARVSVLGPEGDRGGAAGAATLRRG